VPPGAQMPPGQPGQGGQPGQPGQPGARPQDRFFAAIRRSGLHRSQRRIIAGVSGGIAQRTGVDITVVRVLTVVLTIFGGLGVLAYGLAWLFLPEPDGRIHAEQVLRGDVSAGAVGGIITTVLGFGGLGGGWHGPFGWHGNSFFGWFWGLSGTALFVGLVALVIYAIGQSRGRPAPGGPVGPMGPGGAGGPGGPSGPYAAPYSGAYPAPSQPAPPQQSYPAGPLPAYGPGGSPPAGSAPTMMLPAPSATMPETPTLGWQRRATFGGFGALAVAGLAVIGAGITALVMSNGHYKASTAVMAWAVALAVVSAALVAGGLAGRRAGVLTLFAIIATFGTLLAMIPPKMSHLQGAGDRTWQPLSAADASDGYGVGAGDGRLDLTAIDRTTLNAAAPATVTASVGFGRLTILVPSDLAVRVKAAAGAGDLVIVHNVVVNDQQDRGVFLGGDSDHGDVNGIGIHRTAVVGNGPVRLEVDANVGFGEVRIEQVP
jgi:phage shock protein PspC (stress-responsive transcriptional regulator)